MVSSREELSSIQGEDKHPHGEDSTRDLMAVE